MQLLTLDLFKMDVKVFSEKILSKYVVYNAYLKIDMKVFLVNTLSK